MAYSFTMDSVVNGSMIMTQYIMKPNDDVVQ